MGQIHVVVPDTVHEKIKKRAWEQHISVHKWVRQTLEDRIDDLELDSHGESTNAE
jgi:predicted HicB family RNase H-like nuclease